MAIHFNYIKGLNGNVTKLSENTTTSDSDDLYTFIKWVGREPNVTPNKDAKYLPHIYVERTNTLGNNDLGRIITSHAVNQSFYEDISLSNGISLLVGQDGGLKYDGTNLIFSAKQQANMILKSGDSFFFRKEDDDSELFQIKTDKIMSYKPLQVNDKRSNTDYVEIREGNITAGGHIDSLYFNATSDKRAKENIQPATYNAIELIKKLPVYTYNYKNKTETVTGILAQDLLEAQPEELDLVSNVNATGENGDYMSIKNDKLVFILMKAIQEQQEQIEKLQEELNKLKESQ